MWYFKHLAWGIALAILGALAIAHFRPVELAGLGWNFETFGLAGVLLFSVWGSYGLLHQAHTIRAEASGAAVSVVWMIAFVTMFASAFLYGVETDRFALLLQGEVRVGYHIPVFLALWKFRGFTRLEKLLMVAAVAIVLANLFLPRGICYLALSGVSIVGASHQPWKVFRNKREPGSVSIHMISIYLVSTWFWGAYGIMASDPVIWLPSVGYTLIYGGTLSMIMTKRYEVRVFEAIATLWVFALVCAAVLRSERRPDPGFTSTIGRRR